MDVEVGDVLRIRGHYNGSAWEVVGIRDRERHFYDFRKLGEIDIHPASYGNEMDAIWEMDVFLTEVNRNRPK